MSPFLPENQPISAAAGAFLFQEILSQFGRNPHVLWRPVAKRQVLNFHGAVTGLQVKRPQIQRKTVLIRHMAHMPEYA